MRESDGCVRCVRKSEGVWESEGVWKCEECERVRNAHKHTHTNTHTHTHTHFPILSHHRLTLSRKGSTVSSIQRRCCRL